MRVRLVRRIGVLALVASAALGWGAAAQSAAPAGAAVPNFTFSGTCQLSGTTTFSGSTGSFVGDGLCSGNYLGLQPNTTQPAQVKVVESGLFTPALGSVPPLPILTAGSGAMYLWNGVNAYDTCPFITFSVTQVGTVFVLRASGSGEAIGLVTPGSAGGTNASIATLGTLASPEPSCAGH
jgi:hypothetical protein